MGDSVQEDKELCPVDSDFRPLGQTLHLFSASRPVTELYVFIGQSTHCDSIVAFVSLPYFPALQGMQLV